MTAVINIKDAPTNWQSNPNYVYIGRQGKGMVSLWGNPYKLTSEDKRAEVIISYISLMKVMDDKLKERIRGLKGKTLVCFCHPKLCHGDILSLLAETL